MQNQIRGITSAEIVIGTPGRLLDHIKRNTLNLTRINTLVLDEADRMFDMGFRDDVEKIISKCPEKRQTLLFSATISQDIHRLSKKYLKDPVEILAKPHVDPSKLAQTYYDVDDKLKYSLLKHLLESEKSKLVMIFCNTRRNVDFVANNLKAMGFEAVPIHGGYSQDKRNRFLELFHTEKVHILVATDVAARGLDIKGVTHVYNYDIPPSKDEYIHRIGRTARAGEEGKIINILTSRDYNNFQEINQAKEFNIKSAETPYVERVRIEWMPERRFERNGRDNYRGGGRDDHRSGGRDNRSGSRDGHRSRDNRSGSRDNHRSGSRDSNRSGSRDNHRSGSRDSNRSGSRDSYRSRDSNRSGSRDSYRSRDSNRSRDDHRSGGRDSSRNSRDSHRSGRDNNRSFNKKRPSR